MEEKKHNPLPEIPQWVIAYNAKGHQSSAGKALSFTMKKIENLKAENERLKETLMEIAKMDNKDFAYSFPSSQASQQIMFIGKMAKEALQSIEQNKT